MVVGLEPRKEYSCSLSAENGEGSGPAASVNFTTLEDSELLFKCELIHIEEATYV